MFSIQLDLCILFFFFKQKTAYDLRISDWSSDVCSSDLTCGGAKLHPPSSATIRSAIPLRMARLLIAMTLFTRRGGSPLTEPAAHRKIKNRDEDDAKADRKSVV